MSASAISTIWQHAVNAAGTELVLLITLADWSDDEGQTATTVDRLSKRAHVPENVVRASLKRLITLGYLRIQMGGRAGPDIPHFFLQYGELEGARAWDEPIGVRQ